MKNPFQFRDLLRNAESDEKNGSRTHAVARSAGFETTAELREAVRKESDSLKPKHLNAAEKKANDLASIAASAAAEAHALRSEVEEAQLELDRDLRNLAVAEDVFIRIQADFDGIDAAIAALVAQITDHSFVVSTYTDSFGSAIRTERMAIDGISQLRIRKELLPETLASVKSQVEALRKRVN